LLAGRLTVARPERLIDRLARGSGAVALWSGRRHERIVDLAVLLRLIAVELEARHHEPRHRRAVQLRRRGNGLAALAAAAHALAPPAAAAHSAAHSAAPAAGPLCSEAGDADTDERCNGQPL